MSNGPQEPPKGLKEAIDALTAAVSTLADEVRKQGARVQALGRGLGEQAAWPGPQASPSSRVPADPIAVTRTIDLAGLTPVQEIDIEYWPDAVPHHSECRDY